jgi:hypothetical protein
LIKLNINFTGHKGGKGSEGLSIPAVQNKRKRELKIATRVKTLNLKSNLLDAQSIKLIATANFTGL